MKLSNIMKTCCFFFSILALTLIQQMNFLQQMFFRHLAHLILFLPVDTILKLMNRVIRVLE